MCLAGMKLGMIASPSVSSQVHLVLTCPSAPSILGNSHDLVVVTQCYAWHTELACNGCGCNGVLAISKS